ALTLALWRGRLSDLLKEKASLDETSIDQALTVLNIADNTAESIKQVLLKTEDPTVDDINQYISVLFPELQDTALKSMTTSKEGLKNTIRIMLEKEVGISEQANKLMGLDIYHFLEEKQQWI